jgi:hypothetical protein
MSEVRFSFRQRVEPREVKVTVQPINGAVSVELGNGKDCLQPVLSLIEARTLASALIEAAKQAS